MSQVSVIGAIRPFGRSLLLLLKEHPLVQRLAIYDTSHVTLDIVKDLSHIPTKPLVEGWTGQMEFALRGCDVVVVTGGQTKKIGQTDRHLFKENAEFITTTMQEVLNYCPKAFIVIATEPINYTIPLATKVLKSSSFYDKRKVFGVTGLDTMKTQVLISKAFQLPSMVKVPVICGHSSKTILPLLSNIPYFVDDGRTATIIEAVRNNDDVTNYVCGHEKSLLSTTYATYCMVSTILDARNGVPKEHVAFVANDGYGTKFFSSPMTIEKHGVCKIQQFQYLTALEAEYFYHARKQLAQDVNLAESYFVPTMCCQAYANPTKQKIDPKTINKDILLHKKL